MRVLRARLEITDRRLQTESRRTQDAFQPPPESDLPGSELLTLFNSVVRITGPDIRGGKGG